MLPIKKVLVEAVQFLPVITLASSFLVHGEVELGRAGPLFIVAALGAALITAILAARRAPLNPILLGTGAWLVAGAVAFGVPIAPLARIIGRLRAAGLFACTAVVGALLTAASPTGYLGMSHPDRGLVRRWSLALLGLTLAATLWAWVFVDNIRLGGGLPFILLNVARRVLLRRLTRNQGEQPGGS